MASQAVIDDDVFNKTRFVNEVWTQIPPQVGEKGGTQGVQDTAAVIHDELGFEIATSPKIIS
jgi:hypothetical protein